MSNSITNARKPSFMLSCLAIITEGMRSVFETAVGGDKVFYKIFVGYQYMDYGYIISYNNAIHNLDSVYLRSSKNSQPNSDASDVNSRKERGRVFRIARSDPPPAF